MVFDPFFQVWPVLTGSETDLHETRHEMTPFWGSSENRQKGGPKKVPFLVKKGSKNHCFLTLFGQKRAIFSPSKPWSRALGGPKMGHFGQKAQKRGPFLDPLFGPFGQKGTVRTSGISGPVQKGVQKGISLLAIWTPKRGSRDPNSLLL